MTLRGEMMMVWVGLAAVAIGLDILGSTFTVERALGFIAVAGLLALARFFFEDGESFFLGAVLLVSVGIAIGYAL